MFTVTFVRHGETKMNAAKIIQSRTPGELSDRGVKMAESLGVHLNSEKFTRIFSSDLTRCHDTTLHILKQSLSPQPELVLDPTLRERDYGDLEFQSTSKSYEIHVQTGLAINTIPIPGGETYEATMKRTAKFFDGLCKLADATTSSENVLVVTHGCWLMCLLDYLYANQGTFELENCEEVRRTMAPLNTATTRVVIQGKATDGNEQDKRRVQFVHIHDATHLVNAKIIGEPDKGS